MNPRIKQFLESNKIPYELRTYSASVKSAEEASREIHFPVSQMFKSLVCEDKRGNYYLILIPCNKKADLKIIAKDCKFIEIGKVANITGYEVGTVSPFCLKTEMKILIDKSALGFELIGVGCGSKGTELVVNRKQVLDCLNAEVLEIAI